MKHAYTCLGLVPIQDPGPGHSWESVLHSNSTCQTCPSPPGPSPGTAPGVPTRRRPMMGLVTRGAKAGQPSWAPGQTLRPSQVQTACLAPRYDSVRVGRLPTAPVTTNHHLHPAARGPGSQAADTSAGSWGLPGKASFPAPAPWNGQWESWRLDAEIPDASS